VPCWRLSDAAPSPKRDALLADAFVRLGNGQPLQALYPEAKRSLDAAAGLAKHGDVRQRAAAQNALGTLAKDTGRFHDAEAPARRALALRSKDPATDPPTWPATRQSSVRGQG